MPPTVPTISDLFVTVFEHLTGITLDIYTCILGTVILSLMLIGIDKVKDALTRYETNGLLDKARKYDELSKGFDDEVSREYFRQKSRRAVRAASRL